MLQYRNFLFLALLLILASCHSNPWDIDISSVKIDQNFYRFDRELFSINQDSIWNYVPGFEKKYGRFFDLYNEAILKIGGTNQLDYAEKLQFFLTDPYISEAAEAVKKLFADNKFYSGVNNGFRHFHYYFPDKIIPDIYTHISGFNQSLVVDSGFVSISLDKYLGANSKYYAMLRTSVYLRENMYPGKIPSDVMYAWGTTEFPYNSDKDNLSNQMVYYGKMHVFLDAMLPDVPDSVKWGMSAEKLKWCRKNEKQMWLYLVENKLLFNSSYKDIKRFIDDGPFTAPFSKESPSRTGQWIGYQIVNSYLKRHPEVDLVRLMNITDYQMIFNESKYKP